MSNSSNDWDYVEFFEIVGAITLMVVWFTFYYFMAEALHNEQTAYSSTQTQQPTQLANGRLIDSTPRVESVYSARATATTQSPQAKEGN